jgi:hypothetical protein
MQLADQGTPVSPGSEASSFNYPDEIPKTLVWGASYHPRKLHHPEHQHH